MLLILASTKTACFFFLLQFLHTTYPCKCWGCLPAVQTQGWHWGKVFVSLECIQGGGQTNDSPGKVRSYSEDLAPCLEMWLESGQGWRTSWNTHCLNYTKGFYVTSLAWIHSEKKVRREWNTLFIRYKLHYRVKNVTDSCLAKGNIHQLYRFFSL